MEGLASSNVLNDFCLFHVVRLPTSQLVEGTNQDIFLLTLLLFSHYGPLSMP